MHMPRRPNEPYLRFYALGGLGEVGMNCAVIEADGRMIIVDCGVTFPESLHYGIDLIVPDFSPLHAQADRIEALIITHGHMDHIGAVPYLLHELDIPVYAPAMAMELIRGLLDEHGLLEFAELHVVDDETILQVGPFEIEFPSVNHSIPQAHGLAIRTNLGLFVHTGDFKVDHNPVDEAPFDSDRFAHYGEQGVRALFSDSTNVEVQGHSPSERDIRDGLLDCIRGQSGRVFITLFSSNVVRMQSALLAAEATGRSVVLLGRSVERALYAAERAGAIDISPHVNIIDVRDIGNYEHDELLFICTGSQAEPRAALARLAHDTYPKVRLQPSDTVIFSSRTIPGNEQWVYRLYDQLTRCGVNIVTGSDAKIHATGHGYQEDLRHMLELVRPQTLVPVHGDYRFLKRHAALGRACNIHNSHILDNGDILEFTEHDSQIITHFETNRWLVDGTPFDQLTGETFRERRQIARAGVVFVHVTVRRQNNSIVRPIDIQAVGTFDVESEEGRELLADIQHIAERAWHDLKPKIARQEDQAAESIRQAVRRALKQELQRRPHVVVTVQHV